MNVLISGATGLIGSSLIPELEAKGHTVTRLTRSPRKANDVRWDPDRAIIEGDLEGTDAVVHLAGESIAQGRWTPEKKRRILESRVKGTRLLARTIAELPVPPRVLVSVSGSNYYGDRGKEVLREDSPPGKTFLAGVCQEWEASADPAREAGIRVVHPRFGIVLSPKGGALGSTLSLFKLGLGGKIGTGDQYWSWLALDDAVGIILHSLTNDAVSGPLNAGTADPPTNAEYTRVLGSVLGRPTVFPLPARLARLGLGEVADELLLASVRMEPAKLADTGYRFRHPELEGAFRHLLGR